MELLYDFFVYGFIGWMLENIFCYCINGYFQKDGFLKGPFKPMYAIAMVIMIILYKICDKNMFLIVISLVIPTAVEYITGMLMRKYFKKNYWDYSKNKLNYKGVVCVRFSLAWIILAIITIKFINPYIIQLLYIQIKNIWLNISIILISLFSVDEFFTFKSFIKERKIV